MIQHEREGERERERESATSKNWKLEVHAVDSSRTDLKAMVEEFT